MTCKKTCCALALLLAAVPASSTAAASHVLFFLIDDLGYADVGYHGNPVGSKVSHNGELVKLVYKVTMECFINNIQRRVTFGKEP